MCIPHCILKTMGIPPPKKKHLHSSGLLPQQFPYFSQLSSTKEEITAPEEAEISCLFHLTRQNGKFCGTTVFILQFFRATGSCILNNVPFSIFEMLWFPCFSNLRNLFLVGLAKARHQWETETSFHFGKETLILILECTFCACVWILCTLLWWTTPIKSSEVL